MSNPVSCAKAHSHAESQSILDELISTVATGGVKQRLRILQRITDLFVAGSRGYSDRQVALFDDVLRELSTDIEVKARARLANQLADVSNAPRKLIRSLAFDDEIKVAGPVLTRSGQLSDADLIENASTKSQEHLLAIAQRLKLSEAVSDVLVERGDHRVVHKVVHNKGALFSLAGYGLLTTRARHDRKLMLALGQRGDIPRQHYLKLLECASASVRAKLEAANPRAADAIRDAVDDVATAIQRDVRAASPEHALAARDANKRFKLHPVMEAHVHSPAHAQEFEKAVVALSKLGNFPVDLVERALLDEHEDMILILAKAAGCSWTTARELSQMRAAERNMKHEDVAQAFERYKKLNQETARNILNFYGRRRQSRTPTQAGKADTPSPAPMVPSRKQAADYASAPAGAAGF
ncbi:MAG TPA: DUF2336 domain-containing protein [Pseudolabrys sp.]|jgi:uncharacterized protein (DUF2336 family)